MSAAVTWRTCFYASRSCPYLLDNNKILKTSSPDIFIVKYFPDIIETEHLRQLELDEYLVFNIFWALLTLSSQKSKGQKLISANSHCKQTIRTCGSIIQHFCFHCIIFFILLSSLQAVNGCYCCFFSISTLTNLQ